MKKLPRNLGEIVDQLYENLNTEEIKLIRTLETDSHNSAHHTVGRALRNQLGLWNTIGDLNRWFQITLGISHADDISSTILAALWAKVRDEPFVAWNYVKRFKKHWYGLGLDPIGQGSMTYERMREVQRDIGE